MTFTFSWPSVLGREVALKMPLPERVLAPEDVRRFLLKARAAARLDHPNIVRVFDAGEIGPLGYFIASEFCRPEPSGLAQGPDAPVPTAPRRVGRRLADAVQHAHDRGILHRDIKPDNVILARRPPAGGLPPALTDFGLAKLVEEVARRPVAARDGDAAVHGARAGRGPPSRRRAGDRRVRAGGDAL